MAADLKPDVHLSRLRRPFMNIAVVGGGTRCRQLLNVIAHHTFKAIHPKIIAVADIDDNAAGMAMAREKGLMVTNDYNDFFKRDDIELIIELTGSMEIYNDILEKKSKTARAISTETAMLFWEISRLSEKQKITNQKLNETKEVYKVLINELIQEDVLVIAHDYEILDVNQTLLNRLGLTRDEVIGKPCYKITHHQNMPCSGKNHPCPLTKTLKEEKPYQTTHIHLDKDNNEIHYSIYTYPLFENGEVTGAIEISRDITKDINVQKVMMQQEKLASIGRLSAGVAHEINNPLTTILTTAMLMQEDIEKENPTYKEMEIITKETLRCRKIVASLLDFARQRRPNKKNNHINSIVNESIILTKKQAAFKDVAVHSNLFEGLPEIWVDKGQIQQALINLILNAVEATPPGGRIHVETAVDDKHKRVLIIVADTGEGIEKSRIAKVFDPFFTTKESGTGLGLAITHGILEQHGGKIDIKSIKGEGTIFTLALPLEKKTDHDS